MVKLYGRPGCQPCRATRRKLQQLGVPFTEVSADMHLGYLRSLGYASAPVIEVDCGGGATAHWSGYRPDLILELSETLS
jgi:glutaredoxin-like protein NrdH